MTTPRDPERAVAALLVVLMRRFLPLNAIEGAVAEAAVYTLPQETTGPLTDHARRLARTLLGGCE